MKNATTFSALALLLLLSTHLPAQIIYTDIPDATPNATCPLDLNNDAVDDFVIHFAAPEKVMCTPHNGNAYAGELNGGMYLAWALSPTDSICAPLATWYDATAPGLMAWGSSTGYWVGATDSYLALKLIQGADTLYGWARLDFLPGSGSFTLKDYAYQSTPGGCILPGQTSTGISKSVPQTASISPNPMVSEATMQTSVPLSHATLTISNAWGQVVRQETDLSGQTVSLSRDGLPAGLYLVRLTEGNAIIAVTTVVIAD